MFSAARCASQSKLRRFRAYQAVKHETFQAEKGIGGSATTRTIFNELSS